jgi:peptidyl-tRNA hydrolase
LSLTNASPPSLCAAPPGGMVDWVLGEFSKPERAKLEEVLMDAAEAAEDWILDDDIDKVINRVNAPRK